jgi:hypothetical protein
MELIDYINYYINYFFTWNFDIEITFSDSIDRYYA